MILQFPEILSYIIIYLPPIIYTGFSIAMLTFGYLIHKRNDQGYGLYFMISAIVSLTSNILFFALNYPFLSITLFVTLDLPVSVVSIVLTLIGVLFTVFSVISATFLFIALYHVYQTHKIPRVEPNTI